MMKYCAPDTELDELDEDVLEDDMFVEGVSIQVDAFIDVVESELDFWSWSVAVCLSSGLLGSSG